VVTPVKPTGIAKSLNIGNRPTVPTPGRRSLDGRRDGVRRDDEIRAGIRLLAARPECSPRRPAGSPSPFLKKLASPGSSTTSLETVVYNTGDGSDLDAVADQVAPTAVIPDVERHARGRPAQLIELRFWVPITRSSSSFSRASVRTRVGTTRICSPTPLTRDSHSSRTRDLGVDDPLAVGATHRHFVLGPRAAKLRAGGQQALDQRCHVRMPWRAGRGRAQVRDMGARVAVP